MTRAATTLADPCTGAPRRDFLLGLHRGQLVGAHVPRWCSRHGWAAGCSQRAGPPGQLTTRSDQTAPEGTGRAAHWALEQMRDPLLQDRIGRQADGIAIPLRFEELVDFRRG